MHGRRDPVHQWAHITIALLWLQVELEQQVTIFQPAKNGLRVNASPDAPKYILGLDLGGIPNEVKQLLEGRTRLFNLSESPAQALFVGDGRVIDTAPAFGDAG